MIYWDREFAQYKDDYMKLFEKCMASQQEVNIEFLEKDIAKFVGRKHAVALQSGTDALYFALQVHDIGPGDEVLVPDYTWISSASCISMVGATPVFCDVDLDTYHMSLDSIKRMVSDKTKAIIYPHLHGSMTDCTDIKRYCKALNILFVEDACQALGSRIKQPLAGLTFDTTSHNEARAGTIGDCSTLSFNANKVVAGLAGGGAFLTDDGGKAAVVQKLRKNGKGKDFEMLGRNSKMLYTNAEFIKYRLSRLVEWSSMRRSVANKYNFLLKGLNVKLQVGAPGLESNHFRYTVRVKDKQTRDYLATKIEGAGIHYDKPLSENSMYQNIIHRKDNNVNSKTICDTILSLPIHPFMRDEEIERVANTILILG